MFFGLKDAPETLQREMDITLSSVKRQFVLVYLNNINVFLRSPCDHINHVKQVWSPLQDAEGKLKLKNCNFCTGTIDYHDCAIRPRRLEIATHTMTALKKLKPPTNTSERCTCPGPRNVPVVLCPASYR